MINVVSFNSIKDKVFNVTKVAFKKFMKWVNPKIENFPAIAILTLASIGLNSIISDLSIWAILQELPCIFNTSICLPSAVSILIIILLVKIIETKQRKRKGSNGGVKQCSN